MSLGPSLALAAVTLWQTPETGSSALKRRKLALIEEIEAAALAETPVYGIDTLMTFAGYLREYNIDPAALGLNHPGLRALSVARTAVTA